MSAFRFTSRSIRKGFLVTSTAFSLLAVSASQTYAIQEQEDSASLVPSNALVFDDTFNLEFVANPQFIDDKTVVYARQSMDIMTDSRQSRLWQVDIKSGEHRPFIGLDENLSQATLSPNGKMVAYTKAEGNSTFTI